jgi:hypothetical protein
MLTARNRALVVVLGLRIYDRGGLLHLVELLDGLLVLGGWADNRTVKLDVGHCYCRIPLVSVVDKSLSKRELTTSSELWLIETRSLYLKRF